MQATSTTRRFHVHPVWIVTAISTVLLGVLVAGVAVTLTRDESPSVVAPISSVVEPKTNDNFRFAEMNALPDTAPMQIVNFDHLHFTEGDELPGDDVSRIAPASDRLGQRH